jgi:hypothetical protein
MKKELVMDSKFNLREMKFSKINYFLLLEIIIENIK